MRRTRKAARSPSKSTRDRNLPKYSIAVASDLSGIPQQQLRRMEDGGLIAPTRTEGNTRRYSDADLERITEVTQLAEDGVNAAGIRHILVLRGEMDALREAINDLRREMDALRRDARVGAQVDPDTPDGQK